MILAGDIGATKTDMALFSTEAGPRAPITQKEYPSSDYPSLAAIVREFLSETHQTVEGACFGVAGPVMDGVAKTTNLPWLIEESNLRDQFGLATVTLLNDLEATASAVPFLKPEDLHILNPGQPVRHGAIAVIAPGTGLGEAFLIWDGSQYRACPSEGGHAAFAPTDAGQIELLESMREQFGHVSFERVCSANGMPFIYEFLRGKDAAPEWDEVADEIAGAEDKARVIIDSALAAERPSPLCAATLDMFVSILAAEAGNLALKVLATGGVYLGGGIPINILPALEKGRFVDAFQRKGRFSELLSRVPIHVMPSDAALIGVAVHGLGLAQPERAS
ncbi:MAG: glucokinase [Dehalococcoidia bacterium]|nr:glucokinase [Dehalococcoidia bacterium]